MKWRDFTLSLLAVTGLASGWRREYPMLIAVLIRHGNEIKLLRSSQPWDVDMVKRIADNHLQFRSVSELARGSKRKGEAWNSNPSIVGKIRSERCVAPKSNTPHPRVGRRHKLRFAYSSHVGRRDVSVVYDNKHLSVWVSNIERLVFFN